MPRHIGRAIPQETTCFAGLQFTFPRRGKDSPLKICRNMSQRIADLNYQRAKNCRLK
jgi:hypothetical protein